jgi:hypothetical protein
VVHDGSTVGGVPLAKEATVNAAFTAANTASADGLAFAIALG